MVTHRQERGRGRRHRECSRVDRISGRTNGRRKRTKSGSNIFVEPVSYSCRTKIVQAVLDRQRSGIKATIWWFCHDHDISGRTALIGSIGKEWSTQCDLGILFILMEFKKYTAYTKGKWLFDAPIGMPSISERQDWIYDFDVCVNWSSIRYMAPSHLNLCHLCLPLSLPLYVHLPLHVGDVWHRINYQSELLLYAKCDAISNYGL